MTDKKSKDIIDDFESNSNLIGLDKKSSDIVVANLTETKLPMCIGAPIEDFETDDITVLYFVFDESPSMTPVESELIKGFNEIIILGLKGGSSKFVSTIEVGGLVFDENVRPMWGGGFKKLEDLPELTDADYDTDRGYATALYQAVLDALSAVSVRTTEIISKTGVTPKAMIVVLSDGANNCDPIDPIGVKILADSFSNEILVKAFAGFETHESVDFKEIANGIGFGSPFEMKKKPGESDEDMQRRFRHLLGVMSSSIVKQSQTKVSKDSSNTFWQENEDDK